MVRQLFPKPLHERDMVIGSALVQQLGLAHYQLIIVIFHIIKRKL